MAIVLLLSAALEWEAGWAHSEEEWTWDPSEVYEFRNEVELRVKHMYMYHVQ